MMDEWSGCVQTAGRPLFHRICFHYLNNFDILQQSKLSYTSYQKYLISYKIKFHINSTYLMKNIRSTQHYAKNPWHFVATGKNSPEVVNAIIEIPADSKVKYELDKDSGLLKLDRVLFSSVHYPHNYGFIPQTYCDDNDPLDILVICSVSVEPMCLMEAKVIGVMKMVDQGESDDKIIAVAQSDMSVSHINDIEELPVHITKQIFRFFQDYKKMEKKEVHVIGFHGREKAKQIIQESIVLYNETFEKTKSELKPHD